MPDSAVLTFADPDAYHASIRRTQVVEGVVTARGEYRSELTRTDLHRLWVQRGDENLAGVLNFAPSGERVPILFATDQRQAAMHFSGLELSPDEIIVIGFGTASHPSVLGGLSMGCHIPDTGGSCCRRASDHRSRVDRSTFYLSNQTASGAPCPVVEPACDTRGAWRVDVAFDPFS